MFERFIHPWCSFCTDTLQLNRFWFGIAVYIPVRLFLLEARIKHGSIRAYVEFKDQEEEKERLEKHRERYRGLGLS